MKNNKIWQYYAETFPFRYLEKGKADKMIEVIVDFLQPKMALDIGGGTNGTLILKEKNISTWLLDTYVKGPDWIKEQINWNTSLQFDLIVARGCINYLTTEEINKIPFLLKKGGVFVANSFSNRPALEWQSRPFNYKDGKGTEKHRFVESDIIEHKLVFDNGMIIEHEFFYRDFNFWFNNLSNDVYLLFYGNNSVLIVMGMTDELNSEIKKIL